MEQPRYYDVELDNTYCVHFANKQALSIDRIKEIFSEWGDVAGVTKAGDDYGYRFVRYRSENEVKRCIEAMRNNRTIRLLPKRPKQQNNEQKNKNNWTNNNTKPEQTRTPWETKFTESFDKFNKQRDNKELRGNENSHYNDNATVLANEKSVEKTEIPRHDDISVIDDNSGSLRDRREIVSTTKSIPEDSPIGREKISSVEDHDNFEAAAVPKNKDIPIILSKKIDLPVKEAKITPDHSSAVPSPRLEVMINEIPDLVVKKISRTPRQIGKESFAKSASTATSAEKQKIVNAAEIVVANVSADYGENFILHLLRKHEPICVGPMKFVPTPAIRFCVVFFPSARQAAAAESEFDNHELGGKNLIVLRTQSLMEIASTA